MDGFGAEYVMGEMIGFGSQSSVHLCTQKNTGKQYVVKVFKHSNE